MSALFYFSSSSKVGAVIVSVLSSAYVYISECFVVFQISFMYRMKNVVDSVLPCGIPCVIVCGFDCASSV